MLDNVQATIIFLRNIVLTISWITDFFSLLEDIDFKNIYQGIFDVVDTNGFREKSAPFH